jgi:NTP pyrophosphatase (non-canonical NTP hydrolase)
MRNKLQSAARQIAANRNEQPATPLVALRKLFIQERRNWTQPGAPRTGWKRGELFEVAEAMLTGGDWRSEIGDCAYYLAQTWRWLWWIYAAITPGHIINAAVEKFKRRAKGEKDEQKNRADPDSQAPKR